MSSFVLVTESWRRCTFLCVETCFLDFNTRAHAHAQPQSSITVRTLRGLLSKLQGLEELGLCDCTDDTSGGGGGGGGGTAVQLTFEAAAALLLDAVSGGALRALRRVTLRGLRGYSAKAAEALNRRLAHRGCHATVD